MILIKQKIRRLVVYKRGNKQYLKIFFNQELLLFLKELTSSLPDKIFKTVNDLTLR